MAFCGVKFEEEKKVDIQILPTVVATKDFNAEADAKFMHAALEGHKADNNNTEVDKKKILDFVACRRSTELNEVANRFKALYDEDLISVVNATMRKNLLKIVVGRFHLYDAYQAHVIQQAVSGKETDKQALVDIICTKNTDEMETLNKTYKAMYETDLEKAVSKGTSGDLRRILISLASAGREQKEVSHDLAKSDAQILCDADGGKWGTEEQVFTIFAQRSFEQLRLTFLVYNQKKGYTIFEAIDKELSGIMKSAFLTLAHYISDPMTYYSVVLNESLKGSEVDKVRLIRIVLSRCDIDLKTVKERYQKLHGKTLEEDVQNVTKGCYRRAMLAIVRDP